MAIPLIFTTPWTWSRIAIGATIVALSFIAMPNWLFIWLSQTSAYKGFIPALMLPPLLLFMLFWRNKRSRMFALMAITPQHRLFYDQLLLWVIPDTWQEMLGLTLITWIGFIWAITHKQILWLNAAPLIWCLYVPAAIIVLWQQRNTLSTWWKKLHIGQGVG